MHSIKIRHLGIVDYQQTVEKMENFTAQRQKNTASEIWLLQHPAVYTLGQAGKRSHILNSQQIPVIQTNRGGQVTYHGVGQLIAYCLLDLKALGFGVKKLVYLLEQSIIDLLKQFNIQAQRKAKAPGVYVGEAKIAALGLRIRRGYSFHGLALNIKMDLTPYQGINPCGYAGLEVCQMSQFIDCDLNQIEVILGQKICDSLIL